MKRPGRICWISSGKLRSRASDEIILTDVSYPTAGKLDKIDFSNAMTAGNTAEAGRQAQIEGFLREVRDALPKNVILSLELPAETVLRRDEQ